ncbi:metallophosphoesterase [Limosilactobacillus caccae]|jgi:putative phosphoesterase|uniref:metallophosphoesterase n=1 Tax=Limosilactobacillus caccae TaxID=1926284 RepID=UPI000970F42F|nr:metallophosphoesterase [Limosilactobacillus caccae]
MKALIISDNHRDQEILKQVVAEMAPQVDVLIHCGDSELSPTAVPMPQFAAVKGNNDYRLDYPNELLVQEGSERIFTTHGHLYRVNSSLTPLMLKGEEVGATIVCYGHTHQLGVEYDHGMLIINPGSISLPRGKYAGLGGTFAIVDAQPTRFVVDFYDRQMAAVSQLHCEFNRQ